MSDIILPEGLYTRAEVFRDRGRMTIQLRKYPSDYFTYNIPVFGHMIVSDLVGKEMPGNQGEVESELRKTIREKVVYDITRTIRNALL